jgi:hypothetical protein
MRSANRVAARLLHEAFGRRDEDCRFLAVCRNFASGAEGIRTPDLRRAKAALSRLSYGPVQVQEGSLPRLRGED